MVLINVAWSQISAFLDAVHASTELQWVLTENGTEQAGENPGRERMGEFLPEGKAEGHQTLYTTASGGLLTRAEYWGAIQKVCRKGCINSASSSPNAEALWSTEELSAQPSSSRKTR